MNHREEPLNIRAKKKIKKIVRSSVETKSSPPAPRNLRGQNLAKRPRKDTVQEASRAKALKKIIETKRNKAASASSKRTAPGSIEGTPTAPASPHREGKRWIQTTEKQTLLKTHTLRNKMGKRRAKS